MFCEKIELLRLLPVLLLSSKEIHCCQSKPNNQSQKVDLSAVNHTHVCTAHCENCRKTTWRSRKTVYSPSLVAMLSRLSIYGRLCCGELAVA